MVGQPRQSSTRICGAVIGNPRAGEAFASLSLSFIGIQQDDNDNDNDKLDLVVGNGATAAKGRFSNKLNDLVTDQKQATQFFQLRNTRNTRKNKPDSRGSLKFSRFSRVS
jgi:hypothetical protein